MKHRPAAPRRHRLLSAAVVATTFAGAAHAQNVDTPTEVEEVLVIAQRANRESTGATNLKLDIKDTPQSISLVTQEQMEEFGVDNINDALRMATGIQVEQTSTNVTQFLARGFEIKNTQLDGVGLPNGWGSVTNAIDAFGFEKLEVIRGANGLLTGVGNAAGTINFVRKRPTNDAQGKIGVSAGRWGRHRIEADYSTPFNDDGTWAGRAVVAREESDSYLRDFESDRTFLYGVIDGQVGENGTLAAGYSWQESNTNNNMWGALVFSATDGSQLEWDTSSSTTQDWTYWNSTTHAAFVEYTHQLGDDWQAKAAYNYRLYDDDSQLFMGFSFTGLDPATGEGMSGWAYKSPYETTAHLVDLSVNGQFDLFGREQEAVFGVSLGQSERTDYYHPTTFGGGTGALPPFPFDGDEFPEPVWGDLAVYTTLNQRLNRAFGATRLSMTDRFKAVIGFNWAEYQRDGTDDTGTHFDQTESNWSPYAGLTYDFTENILGYVSYSHIFQPQEQLTYDRTYIDPSKGTNYEIGVKAEWLNERLLTTLAWFNAEQEGLATYAGTRFMDGFAFGYYVGTDVESRGVEFEAAGKLNDYADLLFGYTYLKMDGDDGEDTYSWVPRRTANLTFSMRVPSYTALSFGVGGRWQSEISNADGFNGFMVYQGDYTLLNAFAAWAIQPNVTVRANANNITDEKYIQSLYSIGYYGSPIDYSVTLDWRF